jgi:Tfp pilus assembly protein PilN
MQQINFYQTQFKPKKEFLPAWQLLSIIAVVTLSLVVFSVIMLAFQPDPAVQLMQQKQTLKQKQLQLNQLQQKLSQAQENPLLRAEYQKLEKILQDEQALLNYVSSHQLGNKNGFANTLTALSKQHIDNIWLTDFSLLNAGQFIAIKGQTTSADSVPQYIDSLAMDSVFAGKTFSVFNLEKPNGSHFFDFELFTNNRNEANK